MELQIAPGKYVVAVSGGVDSMVLLDILARRSDVQLVVAHYDHGIRADSALDRKLVARATERYGLLFVHEEGELGPGVSEAMARAARYAFLERVRCRYHAQAIVLAHHQDDVLETAILNILRGTGRRGLTALQSTPDRRRPLLYMSKADIVAYAQERHLVWREDSTNNDERYFRNYIRLRLVPRLSAAARRHLLELIANTGVVNAEADRLLQEWLQLQPSRAVINRRQFLQLPHAVAKEVLASWLRQNHVASYNAKVLERVTIAAKVQRPGSSISVVNNAEVTVDRDTLALHTQER